MTRKIGFFSDGVSSDAYMYAEADSGKSISFGFDAATETFNVNTSELPLVSPDEATSNIALDPSANGDIAFQPNGTGKSSFVAGDVNIQSGDLQFANISGIDGQIPIGSSTGPQAWANITSLDASVVITSGANTIDLSISGSAAIEQINADVGQVIPALGIINAFGVGGISTSGAGNILTIDGSALMAPGYVAIQTTASIPNVTGDGDDYTIVCDSILSNPGGGYDSGTGIYTAPSTGNYLVVLNLFIGGLVWENWKIFISVVDTLGITQQILSFENPYTTSIAFGESGQWIKSYSTVIPLTASIGYKINLSVDGLLVKNVDILGSGLAPATPPYSTSMSFTRISL